MAVEETVEDDAAEDKYDRRNIYARLGEIFLLRLCLMTIGI